MESFAENNVAYEKKFAANYWGGFIAGAAIGTGVAAAALYVANALGNRDGRILRLEDSVQIGKPVDQVFRAWTDLESLATCLDFVSSVRQQGNISFWEVVIDGKTFKWQAEVLQFIPNEAIGWKSISGPKHSGRINFSNIGDDTLVHVTMNYAPPLGRFGRMLLPVTDHLVGYISKSLRDFKAAMEEDALSVSSAGPSGASGRVNPGQRKSTAKVDYSRPPQYGNRTR